MRIWNFIAIIALVLSITGVQVFTILPAVGPESAAAQGEDCWTPDQELSGGDQLSWSGPPAMVIDPSGSYAATLETSLGTIELELFADEAPVTVNNFVCLAQAGYYDGTPFHRIIAGFVIQGGDPTGTGTGGPGYEFEDEPIERDYEKGTLAMANAGPDTNGSQFFICTDDLSGQLPMNYTIFGQVTSGIDVVDEIAAVPVEESPGGELSSPVEPVILEEVTIIESSTSTSSAADTLDLEAIDLAWEPDELIVPAGSEVTITVTNNGAAVHHFVIDELEVSSGEIAPGDSATVTFTAPDEAGEYEFVCAMPGHEPAGMTGTLVVTADEPSEASEPSSTHPRPDAPAGNG